MQRDVDLFHEALERPPSERVAFVETEHANDPELVRRLLQLLSAHERAERAGFDLPAAEPVPATPDVDPMPERVGPYRLLELIGEGGMGVVYAAEQSEPLRRRVAIKILKLGMDTREVLARFAAERQAMAILDHPAVAKALLHEGHWTILEARLLRQQARIGLRELEEAERSLLEIGTALEWSLGPTTRS